MRSGWTSPQPRRSTDYLPGSSRTSTPEPRARSSSDAELDVPTPRPANLAPTKFLAATANATLPSPSSSVYPAEHPSSSRIGFFADKLSLLGAHSNQKTQLLHPHLHTRADSSASTITATVPTMASTSKIHTSPSKASYGRTYDSKLVSREMHRLAHPLSSHAPSQTPSSSTLPLNLPAPGTMAQMSLASSASTDPWGALHVHVLPLFNGEPLRIPIEDLNVLVKRHISTVISSSPPKALATLEKDASELIASGMVTLNAKLMGVDDDKLVGRLVETWGFFFDQCLPYVEGVLLPLQTDPLLLSLYRAPNPSALQTLHPTSRSLDVRTLALRSFLDRVIVPLQSRLYLRMAMINKQSSQEMSYQLPRLQQMLLVLSSQGRPRAPMISLTSPPPQPTVGETAVIDLLRIIRSPRHQSNHHSGISSIRSSLRGPVRAPSFLSGGLPRDRRGRIAQKQKSKVPPSLVLEDTEVSGGDDPTRNGLADVERERERAILEALRSPDVEATQRASVGGWGLGAGHEDNTKMDDEDEPLDWDQAQAVVERMVGMTSPQLPEPTRRR